MNTNNIEKALNSFLTPISKFSHNFPWDDPFAYALWSAQTFHFVKQSTRLFALAAAKCPTIDNATHFKFLKHLHEERGHEALSKSDVEIAGFDLKEMPETVHTRLLYQSQYFYISEVSAYSFFGYLLALEAMAVNIGPTVYKKASATHGKNATKFLKVHTEEDVNHLAEAINYLQEIDQKHEDAIIENIETTCSNYLAMLNEASQLSLNRFSKTA